VRKTLRASLIGLLFVSFALAILAPAFAGTRKDECAMSCCRLGMRGAHAMPMPAARGCGHCECSLEQGAGGSFAVPSVGLLPSVLPAAAVLPKPRPALAHLAGPASLLDSRARDLPFKPPRS
jgi:hypothetical protein